MKKIEYTKEQVDKLLNEAEYTFAKSMPDTPHYYTKLFTHWKGRKGEFFEVVKFVWNNSVKEHWKWGKYYNYYYANGYKYWSANKTIEETILINRVKV